jgi:LysM repeat protein
MYSVAQGKALMKSPAKRWHWNSKKRINESWNGWCAAWTYWFTGAARSFATAYDAFLHTKIVSKRAADAPAGAVHYWRNIGSNPRPGHVAVSLGQGIAGMASNRVETEWGVGHGTVPIATYNRQTGGFLQYLGWSYDFGGQRMAGVHTVAEVKAAIKSVPKTHTVRRNENLGAIARANGVSVPAIVALNKKKYPSLATDPDTIQVGWKLKLN